MPSPQNVTLVGVSVAVHVELHVMQDVRPYGHTDSSTVLPSSHTSGPPGTPSPHTLPASDSVAVQSWLHSEHVAVPYGHSVSSFALPSSHASTRGDCVSLKPSPHTLSLQSVRQLSPSTPFMSSHCSPAARFCVPSPH